MTTRVALALTAVRVVAERTNPLEPLSVGSLAERLGISLSRTSRLCADLSDVGLLEPSGHYGAYRLGRRAIRLSGRAAAPIAGHVQLALAEAARVTGETVCIAAAVHHDVRVVSAIESGWTLFVPAAVGESVEEDGSAIRLALAAPKRLGAGTAAFETIVGVRIEVAAPIRDPAGETVGVVAVRLPRNRTRTAVTRARRAVGGARAQIETAIARIPDRQEAPAVPSHPEPDAARASSLEVVTRLVEQLADGVATSGRSWRALGIPPARGQRLLAAAVESGLVMRNEKDGALRLSWTLHLWHRAAVHPILTRRADQLVAETSAVTGQSAFLTVMRRMRSVTLVEKLVEQPDGLAMAPWLGRPCPLEHSDGGPALLLDYGVDEIATLVPGDTSPAGVRMLRNGMREILREGVFSQESAEEAGQIGITAPVRDSSGLVVAASCIVGPTSVIRSQLAELRASTVDLAARVSELLGAEG